MIPSENLPPVNTVQHDELYQGLSDSTTFYQAPSFAQAGARSGYIRDRLDVRSSVVGNLALHPSMEPWCSALAAKGNLKGGLSLHAFGGGPGFEVLGLAMVAAYLELDLPVDGTVLDNEPGWGAAVAALGTATKELTDLRTCDFALCDILTGAVPDLQGVDIVTFGYVCLENCLRLREAGFAFLLRAFAAAEPGCTFIFMDASPRMFPEIGALILTGDLAGKWEQSYVRCKRTGWVLVLRCRGAEQIAAVLPVAKDDQVTELEVHFSQCDLAASRRRERLSKREKTPEPLEQSTAAETRT